MKHSLTSEMSELTSRQHPTMRRTLKAKPKTKKPLWRTTEAFDRYFSHLSETTYFGVADGARTHDNRNHNPDFLVFHPVDWC